MTTGVVRRPGVVTFIGVLLYIWAFLGVVAAVTTISVRNNADVQAATGQTGTHLLWAGIILAAIAVLRFIIAAGLMAGGGIARMVVAVVLAVDMGYALALMLIHHSGAYLYSGLVTLLIGTFVLWALYGNERSEAFFEQAA